MRKYFLFFFAFVLAIFFLSVVQQEIAYAAGKLGDICTGSGQGTCSAGLFCTPPDWNNPIIEQTCIKTHNQSTVCKSHCTLAGVQQDCKKNSDCQTGLICVVKNQNMCDLYGAKNPHACDMWCIIMPTPTLVPPGGKCTKTSQCASGSTCTSGKCTQPAGACLSGPGEACQGSPAGDQGSCASGCKCTGVPPDCLHLGICQGTCTGSCTSTCPGPKPPTQLPPPPSPPCKQWDKQGVCQKFGSTFGDFSTDPPAFVQKLFAILLSISGGIALLLIIKAGYQLMTAQGNPEKLNNGREQLVAAIVGLVFLIFSFVFLQLIGFDILHIPGFGK